MIEGGSAAGSLFAATRSERVGVPPATGRGVVTARLL
jgi:hypothetical protein